MQELTAQKIIGFSRYPEGWRYGRGATPSRQAIATALEINYEAALAGFETDGFLGEDKEIRVTIYHGDHYLQFTIDDEGLIECVRENGRVEVARKDALSREDALTELYSFVSLCHDGVLRGSM